jgi:serine beta-lactamase-like protein LACTB
MKLTTGHRRWWLRLALLIVAIVAFKALEPVFVYSWGWRELPALVEAPAVESADPDYAAAITKAVPLVRELQQRLQLPGIAIAVGIDGREVWAYSSGYADLATARPLQLDSQFRIGSTTKAFTSAAMATLVQAGKVDLDAPLQTYLTWFAPRPWPVSTRQVMSHTAGLPDYGLCLCFPIWEYYNRRHFDSVRDANAAMADAPLRFAPGTDFAYTSLGYNLAGGVIESVTNEDFLAYLTRAVLAPLELTHTRADDPRADLPGRATFYETKAGEYKPVFAVDNSNKWPSGGLLSTPRDLVRFGNGILTDRLFDAATRERFWTVQPLASGKPNDDHYALGWRVFDDQEILGGRAKTTIVSHNGVATGATSRFALYPQHKLTIAILTNAQLWDTNDLSALSGRIVDGFLELEPR